MAPRLWRRKLAGIRPMPHFLRGSCWFAHHPSRHQIKPFMSKGERISRLVEQLSSEHPPTEGTEIHNHPNFRAFFHCWNEQLYYEAHDVLEQLWLKTQFDRCRFLQGPDPVGRGIRPFAKAVSTPFPSKARPSFAPRGSSFSVGRETSRPLRAGAACLGRQIAPPAFAAVHRSNCGFGFSDKIPGRLKPRPN